MTEDVKKTPDITIGNAADAQQPRAGASSARSGAHYARDIDNKVPYALLEKTNQLPQDDSAQNAANVRWLRQLGATSANATDYEKAWETDGRRQLKSEHEWRDTYGGKIAIRTFSRGILGSVFFTAGQHIAGVALKDYSYHPTDASKNSAITNPIAFAARLIDKTLGAGIYNGVKLVSNEKAAHNAVTFRHTNNWAGYGTDENGKPVYGRSFGHEGMAITFDFGMASLGDYMGREIAGLIDPNTEKKWMKDGHIDVPEATKALLKSIWTGTSKAMGEDYFAMAAGYPYVVRGTRNLINKYSPGFKYDSDRWANGGSFKVDDHNNIVGNYQLEGMADLGLRFSAYNVYTKMYRDGYDKVASKVKQFWDGDRTLHMPHFDTPPTPANLLKKAADGVASAVQYVVRTVIKVGIIMVPSSAIFAFIRSAQSKDIGLAIHPEHGPIGLDRGDGNWSPIFTNGAVKSADGKRLNASVNASTSFFYQNGKHVENFDAFMPRREGYERRFDPFGKEVAPLDKATNIVGRFCHDAGHVLTEAVKPFARAVGIKDAAAISKHTQRYVDATLAYTPYFMAKTDLFSTAYDTPRMDMSIDRMTSGVAHLNMGEIKAGGSEVVHTILNRPFTDPDREKIAQKKMRTYTNQLWSNQDEILAKEREEEFQERMDAMLTLGKPIPMSDLYRRPFTERVKKSPDIDKWADGKVMQTLNTAMESARMKQGEETWHDRTATKDFKNSTASQGQTVS